MPNSTEKRRFPLITEDAQVSAALWVLSSVLFEIARISDQNTAGKENQEYTNSHFEERNE
jgi:hypothetical protein